MQRPACHPSEVDLGTAGIEDQALQYVLAPMSYGDFFDQYYERQLLHVSRNSSSYYAALLTVEDLDRTLSSTAFRASDLRVINSRVDVIESDYVSANDTVDIARVRHLHARGSTILMLGTHRYHAPLAKLCSQLETAFGGPVGANTYITPDQQQGFGPHFDTHDVLTLQISGAKRWRVFGWAIELPVTAHEAAARRSPSADARYVDVELRPGDTLYVPRGVVHSPECVEGTSIHLSVHLLCYTWADLLRESLMQCVLSDPEFRRAVPPPLLTSGAEHLREEGHFRDLVRTFAARADFERARGELSRQLAARKS